MGPSGARPPSTFRCILVPNCRNWRSFSC